MTRFILLILSYALLNSLYSSPTIHVIGDSHSREFSRIHGCKIHYLGPRTMHRVGRDGLELINLKRLGIQEGEIVVFAFGEIDVRCHIGYQRDVYHRDEDEIIDTLANRYIYTILLNRAFYQNLVIVVYSVTPPIEKTFSPSYPFHGTLQDRVAITKKLNSRLHYLCRMNGIEMLDVYDDYAIKDGSLRLEISDGGVHIHEKYGQAIQDKLWPIIKRKYPSRSKRTKGI